MAALARTVHRRAVVALGLCLLLVLVLMGLSHRQPGGEVQAPGAILVTQAQVIEAGRHYPPQPPADAAWQAVTLPDNWDGRRPDYTGYVWYHIDMPAQMAHWQRPALYLPAAGMNAELWFNGQRVGGSGRMQTPVSRHFYTPQLIELPPALLREPAGRRELWILLAGHPGYRCGLAPVWLGEHDGLFGAWRQRRFWQTEGNAATIVINLSIAVFVLLVGWRDPAHQAYRWFGAATLVWALRNLNYWVTNPVIPDLLFAELCVSGAAWFVALFSIFAMRFSETYQRGYRGPKALQGGALAYAVIATVYFLSASDYAHANAGFALLAAVGVGLTVWSMLRLVRLALVRPTGHLMAVACGAVIYLMLLLNDYAIGINRASLGEIFMRQYAALPLFVAVTATLARRYGNALQRTRELAASLQSQVQAQRAQLEHSFEQLREAEREQARAQERARVMGDLHDGLGMHLATALRQARTEGLPREWLASSLQDCLDELRVAVDSLDEQERDPLSLLGSLRYRMAPRFEALGIRLDWHVAPDLQDLPVLDPSQALHLLRIVQEILGNALKHSQASVVSMSLASTAQGTLIRITDNGRGFDPAQVAQGRGLGHLQSRAQRLGSQLEWQRHEAGITLSLLLGKPCGSPAADAAQDARAG